MYIGLELETPPEMKKKSGELQYELLLKEMKFKPYSYILYSMYYSKLIIPSREINE